MTYTGFTTLRVIGSTVESPHLATLPSVQLPPVLGELLTWRLTLDALGCKWEFKMVMPSCLVVSNCEKAFLYYKHIMIKGRGSTDHL